MRMRAGGADAQVLVQIMSVLPGHSVQFLQEVVASDVGGSGRRHTDCMPASIWSGNHQILFDSNAEDAKVARR